MESDHVTNKIDTNRGAFFFVCLLVFSTLMLLLLLFITTLLYIHPPVNLIVTFAFLVLEVLIVSHNLFLFFTLLCGIWWLVTRVCWVVSKPLLPLVHTPCTNSMFPFILLSSWFLQFVCCLLVCIRQMILFFAF